MKIIILIILILFTFLHWVTCMLPPKFQWKTIDFAWGPTGPSRLEAIRGGHYIPQNIMPTGLARWKNKLFITIPRWKTGVPASLNYIHVNGTQQQPLIPYPSWADAFMPNDACCLKSNSTVVSTFRVHVDTCDRLWVVDNGVDDMSAEIAAVADASIAIFDLKRDILLHRHMLSPDVVRDSSVLTSIVVDIGKDCKDAYAYITDMGSEALIVYSLETDVAWRLESPHFHFDPEAGVYKVGGIDFYWNDGISSAALSQTRKDGFRDLYLQPTSSTKQLKLSTKLLRNKDVTKDEITYGVQVVGDKGPKSQTSACDYDQKNNVLFFTQISKNGVGCWNTDKPFNEENVPVIISDCNVMEFPNDIKVDQEGNVWILSDRQSRFLYNAMDFDQVDQEGNVWILSDRQSRFLYNAMDFDQVNFRIMMAPVSNVIQGTACAKQSAIVKAFNSIRPKSGSK